MTCNHLGNVAFVGESCCKTLKRLEFFSIRLSLCLQKQHCLHFIKIIFSALAATPASKIILWAMNESWVWGAKLKS
jgi:hypothetical protein